MHGKPGNTALSVTAICVAALSLGCRSQASASDLARTATENRIRAERGDPDAQYRVGAAYYYGKGVPRNDAEAVRWFRKSAGQGYPLAQCRLASFYFQGQGVPQDLAESARWYVLRANQGDAVDKLRLGYLYAHGAGVPRNLTEAARWYRAAAEQGDSAAAVLLASAYREGLGVPRNYLLAARWYLAVVRPGRAGWTLPFSFLLTVGALAVPARRWGRSYWLFWTLLFAANAALAFHLISHYRWSGVVHSAETALIILLAILCAWGAMFTAGHRRPEVAEPPER